jgi:hypothetical protein
MLGQVNYLAISLAVIELNWLPKYDPEQLA